MTEYFDERSGFGSERRKMLDERHIESIRERLRRYKEHVPTFKSEVPFPKLDHYGLRLRD